MKITIIGSGDAFGSGGRFNTCFLVETGFLTFLIDCGASSLVALKKQGISLDAIDAIFISHLHGDHYGGLPFFILDARYVHKRTRALTIAGPPTLPQRLDVLMEACFAGSTKVENLFDLAVQELPVGGSAQIDGVSIATYEMHHPSGAPSLGLQIDVDGRRIAYSGDTQWVPQLQELARGADLFICECYAPDDPVPMHLSYPQIMANIDNLNAKKIVLTHMGAPMLDAVDRVDTSCVTVAYDGMVIDL